MNRDDDDIRDVLMAIAMHLKRAERDFERGRYDDLETDLTSISREAMTITGPGPMFSMRRRRRHEDEE